MNLPSFRTVMKTCGLLIILFVAGLASCNKDDGPDEDPIIGVWQLSSITYDGENVELSPCENQETVEFKANNTYVFTGYYSPTGSGTDCILEEDAAESGTWSIPSKGKLKITYVFEGESFSETVSYTISGNKLTINATDDIYEYTRK